MPQLYNQAVMTEAGLGMLTKAQAGEIKIQFTRIAVGNGTYTDGDKKPDILQEAASLKSAKNSYPLSSVQAVSGNSVKLTVLITNQDPVTGQALVEEGYYLNEVGLYAKEKDGDGDTEVLYSIAVTAAENGDYMPPYNGHSPAQIVQEYYAAVSNGAEIVIRVDPGAPLTVDGDASNTTVTFEQAVKRAEVNPGDTLGEAFGKLSKFCGDIQPVAFTGTADYLAVHEIEPGTDLNAITGPGFYRCITNAIADTLQNKPSNNAFFMVVGIHASMGIYQRAVEFLHIAPKIFFRNCHNDNWSEWYREYTTADKPVPADIGAASVGELTGSWSSLNVNAVGWYRIAKREIGTSYPSPCTVSIKKVWNNGTSECHKFEIINLGESAVIKSIYDKTLHESYAQFTKVRLVNGAAEAYVDIYSSKSLSNNLTVTFSDSVSSGGHAWTLLPSAQIVPETAAGETVLASLELKADYWVANDLPLSLDKGGTGKTTAVDAANVLINGLSVGTDAPQDEDAFISQFAGGGKTNNDRFYRRPVSKLWDYIKSKLATVATSGNYNDLGNKPFIPSVGNGTVTIKQAGTSKGTFAMNQSGDTTIELTDSNTTYGVATHSANGLMSAADKKKLDEVAEGATNTSAVPEGLISGYVRTGQYSGTAIGDYATAEGYHTTASGDSSHAEGNSAKATGNYSHAEGFTASASGDYSHAEGNGAKATGKHSHAEGEKTTASGYASHAEGEYTTASGSKSHAEGSYTEAYNFSSHAGGKYNKTMATGGNMDNKVGDVFMLGNGTGSLAKSNAFRITYQGQVYGLANFNASGADYAEFIKPWADGNPDDEDRVGYFVTVKDGLLYKADEGGYIAGVTSGNPSVVGNADEDYYWRWERDEFNRFILVDVPEMAEKLDDAGNPVLDGAGNPVMEATGKIIKNGDMKQAENYDPELMNDYVERKDRKEWDYVGMVGVIPVRDDGTCEVDRWCKCNDEGIATYAETIGFDTFRVIERVNNHVVKIVMR